MDELIQAMSDNDLAELRDRNSGNTSLVNLINGIIDGRRIAKEQQVAKDKFTSGIVKTFEKLPHPDDVHNIFIRWAEVEETDETAEAEVVEVVTKPAEVDKDGKITTPAVIGTESRKPTHKVWKWVVELNKAFNVQNATTRATTGTSKRAITVLKRDDMSLKPMGNFASASKACEKLGLTVGTDSAMRVLAREGYIVEPYTGTDIIQ